MSAYEFKTLSEYQRLIDRFENVNDGYLLPDVRLIVRIDAHRFGDGWSGFKDQDYPYHKAILETLITVARKLMCLDLRVNYAFIHGDEISLLFDKIEGAGLRRRAKFLTHIASAGAVFFLEEFKLPVFFRAKLSELPSDNHVIDYFFWQRKVALRNYFSRAFGTLLSERGRSAKEIASKISGLTEDGLWEMAVELGIEIESIPSCFLFGTGLWWQKNEKENEILILESLPGEDNEYLSFLNQVISGVTFIPEEAGVFSPWRMVTELQKTQLQKTQIQKTNLSQSRFPAKSPSSGITKGSTSKESLTDETSSQFRIGGRKGMKVIGP